MNHSPLEENIREKKSHLQGFSFSRHPLISVLILFFLLESLSSFVFYWQMIELTPFSYAVTALLADMILPVLAVTIAYFYQSRL